MAITAEELGRAVEVHDKRLNAHSDDIRDLQLWRAKVQGFLLALTVFASLPTVILGYMALTEGPR